MMMMMIMFIKIQHMAAFI